MSDSVTGRSVAGAEALEMRLPQAALLGTADFREAISASIERRTPNLSGI
jgi:hypothetical protein